MKPPVFEPSDIHHPPKKSYVIWIVLAAVAVGAVFVAELEALFSSQFSPALGGPREARFVSVT